MKKILQLTIFLAVVAALSTGVLAFANYLTKDKIAEQAAGAETAALNELYPDAQDITVISDFEADADGLVEVAYAIDDEAYAFRVSSMGYSNPIVYIIGFDADGTNSKFEVIDVQDTQGYGSKVAEDEYIGEMTGLSTTDTYPLISGATVSTSAVTRGVAAAVEVFNSITGQTGGPVVVEPEKPMIVMSEIDPMDAEATLVESDDPALVIYDVRTPGYNVIVDGGSAYNTYTVTINTELREVVSVELSRFSDTQYIGDKVDNEYLANYSGMSLDDDAFTLDVVSGATVTSESAARAVHVAVQAALNELGE